MKRKVVMGEAKRNVCQIDKIATEQNAIENLEVASDRLANIEKTVNTLQQYLEVNSWTKKDIEQAFEDGAEAMKKQQKESVEKTKKTLKENVEAAKETTIDKINTKVKEAVKGKTNKKTVKNEELPEDK